MDLLMCDVLDRCVGWVVPWAASAGERGGGGIVVRGVL